MKFLEIVGLCCIYALTLLLPHDWHTIIIYIEIFAVAFVIYVIQRVIALLTKKKEVYTRIPVQNEYWVDKDFGDSVVQVVKISEDFKMLKLKLITIHGEPYPHSSQVHIHFMHSFLQQMVPFSGTIWLEEKSNFGDKTKSVFVSDGKLVMQ